MVWLYSYRFVLFQIDRIGRQMNEGRRRLDDMELDLYMLRANVKDFLPRYILIHKNFFIQDISNIELLSMQYRRLQVFLTWIIDYIF